MSHLLRNDVRSGLIGVKRDIGAWFDLAVLGVVLALRGMPGAGQTKLAHALGVARSRLVLTRVATSRD